MSPRMCLLWIVLYSVVRLFLSFNRGHCRCFCSSNHGRSRESLPHRPGSCSMYNSSEWSWARAASLERRAWSSLHCARTCPAKPLSLESTHQPRTIELVQSSFCSLHSNSVPQSPPPRFCIKHPRSHCRIVSLLRKNRMQSNLES